MTVTNTTSKASFTGNGVTTAFTFDFKIFADTDLEVYLDSVLKTLTTDYTVALDSDTEGGTVTFVSAPTTASLGGLIKRTLDQTQDIKVPVENRLPSEQVEKGYDKPVMLIQQLQEALDRSAKLPTTTSFAGDLALPEPEAGKYVGWNADASALENKDIINTSSAFTVPALTGNGLKEVRVNAGGTNYEYFTPPSPLLISSFKKMRSGPLPTWTSASTITIPAGVTVVDSTGVAVITTTAPLVISLVASGVLGIDTGAEGASHFYHPYLIMKTDGTVSALVSLVDESTTGSITLPTGYATGYKAQLPFAVYNNSGSDLLQFFLHGWNSWTEFVVNFTDFSVPTNGDTLELAVGTADGAFHTVTAAFVPTSSNVFGLLCRGDYTATARSVYVIPTGSGLSRGHEIRPQAADQFPERVITIRNTSRQFDYKIAGSGTGLYVDTLRFMCDKV